MRWNCPICGEEITGLGWRHHRSAHAEAYSKIVFGTILLLVGAAVLGLSSLLAIRYSYSLPLSLGAIGGLATELFSVALLFRTTREARAQLRVVSRDRRLVNH